MKNINVVFDITDKDGNDVLDALGLPEEVTLDASLYSDWEVRMRMLLNVRSVEQFKLLQETLEDIAEGVHLTQSIKNHRQIYRSGLGGVNTTMSEAEYILERNAEMANVALHLYRRDVRRPKVKL